MPSAYEKREKKRLEAEAAMAMASDTTAAAEAMSESDATASAAAIADDSADQQPAPEWAPDATAADDLDADEMTATAASQDPEPAPESPPAPPTSIRVGPFGLHVALHGAGPCHFAARRELFASNYSPANWTAILGAHAKAAV